MPADDPQYVGGCPQRHTQPDPPCADQKVQIDWLVVSKVRLVHSEPLLLAEREVLTILGDPHNELRLAVLVVDCNRVAHRIRSAENSAGECLVYDDNGLRALPVGGR